MGYHKHNGNLVRLAFEASRGEPVTLKPFRASSVSESTLKGALQALKKHGLDGCVPGQVMGIRTELFRRELLGGCAGQEFAETLAPLFVS